jgi:hypothetical protein
MKKRVKITKRLLREAMEDGTMPPQGVNKKRVPTEKMSPKDIEAALKNPEEFDVPEDIQAEFQKALEKSKSDPTQKMRLTDRVKTWMKSLFAPKQASLMDTEEDVPVDIPREKPKPRFSSPYEATPEQRAQNKKFGELIGKVTAAKLTPEQPYVFPEDEFLVDAPSEEEEIDPDAYGLKEIAKRHFTKD